LRSLSPNFPEDDSLDLGQLVRRKTSNLGHPDWHKPELGVASCMGDVDVRRFMAFHTEKEKSIPSNPQ
jgi:hypothetical protein